MVNISRAGWLTSQQVALRWACAEAQSPRWRSVFAKNLSPDVLDQLTTTPPEVWAPDVQHALIAALRSTRHDLLEAYLPEAARFRVDLLSVSALEAVWIMREMGWEATPVSLSDYMEGPHDPALPTDPRVAARLWQEAAAEEPESVGYPILSRDENTGVEVLVEGYTRCIAAILRERATGQDRVVRVIRRR